MTDPVSTERLDGDNDDWSNDTGWNLGVNYAIERLCEILGVDPKSISWDAATETVNGDVMSIICNALVAAYGDEWSGNERETATIRAALAARQAPEGVRVKPLQWRVPTDHPKDPDVENNDLCADGVGGIYAISNKQTIGPERLLWMADDPFVWKACGSIQEAKAAAQADYEARILSTIEPVTQTVTITVDEVERIILETEPAQLSDRGDKIWTRRMAVALTAALKGASHDQP